MGIWGDRSNDPPILPDTNLKSPNWVWNGKDSVLAFSASGLKMEGNGNWNVCRFWLFEKKGTWKFEGTWALEFWMFGFRKKFGIWKLGFGFGFWGFDDWEF